MSERSVKRAASTMQPDDRYLILRIDDERLELADGNIATALALPRDEAGERLERAWAEAPLAVMTALAWGPVAERLRVRAGVGFEGLLDLVLRGEIAVLDQRRTPLGARGPLPPPPGTSRRPSGTTPQADDALVNPVIGIGSVLLLVRKRYLDERKQPRDPIRLSTDSAFDGEGRFTCTSPALLFFRDAVGGRPLDLAQTRLAGADLTGGVILHAEARSPSAAMEDIELRLHLVGGSKARGPDDVVAVTAVELTLDIFSDALPAGERPLAGKEKVSPGRFLPPADDKWHNDVEGYGLDETDERTGDIGHPRARLVVRPAKPASFDGKLVLRRRNNAVRVMRRPALSDQERVALPLELAPPHASPRELFVEGSFAGTSHIDLGIVGHPSTGDSVRLEVVSATISRSERTALGYDDMDGALYRLHHVSIEEGKHTHVHLNLGGNVREGLFVASANPSVAVPRAPTALEPGAFDLRIDAAAGRHLAHTFVAVRVGGPAGRPIAAIGVHVYRVHRYRIGVLRVHDPLSPLTQEPPAGALVPMHPIAELEARVNELFRLLLVRVELIQLRPDPFPVRFDLDGDGILRLQIGPDPELSPIRSAIGKPAGLDHAIAIVAEMDYRMDLSAPALPGAETLAIDAHRKNASYLTAGWRVTLVGAKQRETIVVTSTDSRSVATLKKPIKGRYRAGDYVTLDIGGISSAPSVVDQRTAGALAGARLTGAKLAHEIGHHLLRLADVEVAGNFMFNGQGPDTPPRYKRLAHRYHPADDEPPRERQWNARRKPSGR